MFKWVGWLLLFPMIWGGIMQLGHEVMLAVLAGAAVWHWRGARQTRQQLDQLHEQLRALQARVAALDGAAAPRSQAGEAARQAPESASKPAPQRAAAPASVPIATPAAAPAAAPATAAAPAAAPVALRRPMPQPGPQTPAAPPPAPARSPRPAWPEPPPPVDEHSPAVTASLGASVLAWFSGGNTIVRLAVLILFIGVAFLVRYAAENALLPLELRLAATVLGGLALSGVGWRLRERRRAYGLTLQGAGVGVVYLVLFAAFRLYGLLPAGLVFALMLGLGAATVGLALRQNAMPLAALAFAGGFLAPVLTSTGHGSHVALLSFYLMLNLGIAWIAWHKAWKLLNAMGFAFTFGVSLAWGWVHWQPAFLASTQVLLIAHLALYLFITVQYSRNLLALKDARLPLVDGGLLFAVPLAAFGLQAGMVRHIPYALAGSALVLAGVYGVLSRWLWRRARPGLLVLSEGLLALGVVFLALVAPLALTSDWVSSTWALQGAGMLWVALRQRRAVALLLSLLLQGLAVLQAGGEMLFNTHSSAAAWHWLWNAQLLGAALTAGAAGFSALQLQRAAQRWRVAAPAPRSGVTGWQMRLEAVFEPARLEWVHWGLLIAATVQAVCCWLLAVMRAPWYEPDRFAMLRLSLLALALAYEGVHRRLAWMSLALAGRALLALALGLSVLAVLDGSFSSHAGWPFWRDAGGWQTALLLAGGGWVLWRVDHDRARPQGSQPLEPMLWLGLALAGVTGLAHALGRAFIGADSGWTHALPAAAALLSMQALLAGQRAGHWPMARHPAALQRVLAWPVLGLGVVWVAGVNLVSAGNVAPLPFVPLLNPLDLTHLLLLGYGWRVWRDSPPVGEEASALRLVLAGSVFWWVNAATVRTLHHWAGTPLWLDGALGSSLVQTTLSLVWTLCALAAMAWGSWRRTRPAWMAGAGVLGAVVVKLLLVDLSQSGALMRIISFIGVGLLMLLIGYLAPLPPARKPAG